MYSVKQENSSAFFLFDKVRNEIWKVPQIPTEVFQLVTRKNGTLTAHTMIALKLWKRNLLTNDAFRVKVLS